MKYIMGFLKADYILGISHLISVYEKQKRGTDTKTKHLTFLTVKKDFATILLVRSIPSYYSVLHPIKNLAW